MDYKKLEFPLIMKVSNNFHEESYRVVAAYCRWKKFPFVTYEENEGDRYVGYKYAAEVSKSELEYLLENEWEKFPYLGVENSTSHNVTYSDGLYAAGLIRRGALRRFLDRVVYYISSKKKML